MAAQRDYETRMKLNLVGDQNHSKTSKFPLHLPIDNTTQETNARFIDLYLHHRTQQLMCLEFDLTHMKLDDTESSFSGEFSDNLSINPLHGEVDGNTDQPTPFLGVAKNSGSTSYG